MEPTKEKTKNGDEIIASEFRALDTGGKVRFLMELQGFTMEDIGKLLGITRQAFSNQLNHADWMVSRLKKVADILNVPPQILL